jgi:SAM-dependent methyltransferase
MADDGSDVADDEHDVANDEREGRGVERQERPGAGIDDRVRRTVETYETNADAYAERHGDREGVAEMVGDFVDAVGRTEDRTGDGPARVLDVGPGPGWESAAFADHGFETVAVDLTRSFLEQTRAREAAVGTVRGDMRALPFADGRFAGLWACASLLHVPREDVPATLAGFERVLTPGGIAVVSVQRERAGNRAEDGDRTAESGSSPYDDDGRHFELYTPEDAAAAFATAGFDDVDVTVHDDWVRVTARTG